MKRRGDDPGRQVGRCLTIIAIFAGDDEGVRLLLPPLNDPGPQAAGVEG